MNQGAQVSAYEPFKLEAGLKGIDAVPSLDLALEGAEALLLLVDHTQFRELDPQLVAAKTTARVAIDAVNGWDVQAWTKAGFEVYRLGVKKFQSVKQKS